MSNSSNNKQKDEMLSAVSYLVSAYDEIEFLMNQHTNMEIKISDCKYNLLHRNKINIELSPEEMEGVSDNINLKTLLKWVLHLFLTLFTLGSYLIVLIIYYIYKSKKGNTDKKPSISELKEKKREEYIEKLKNQLSDSESEKVTLENKIRAFGETEEWIKAKSLLPKEIFENTDAIYIIHNYVKFGRADTWKEAYNLYFDESHKVRMEELAIAQLDVAEQNLQVQKEICELSQALLSVSIEQRNQIFKISESLQRQQEIMLNIRKTTNKTAKAARLTAFCTVIGLFK